VLGLGNAESSTKHLISLGILESRNGIWDRGTGAAKGRCMSAIAEPIPNPACEPSLSDDWVDVHADYLFNFAIGQVRDVNVAEDLVQETFLAAVRSRSSFSGQSSERTWLVGILRHKICDHLRRTCRERAVRAEPSPQREDVEGWDQTVLWLHDAAAECHSAARRMELREFREALELALGKLPPRLAQVFQMYEIEEQPNRVVCSRLNISESNLWVMLHRARKQLREELAGWWNSDARKN
jgi:RNA polymerase sigma-70 factor (ECF subfamily)